MGRRKRKRSRRDRHEKARRKRSRVSYSPDWSSSSSSSIFPSYCYINFPSGSKCEALRLGVHLILLYFIRISLLYPKTFFLFCCGCGCGWRTFFVFKSLDNNMIYSLDIDVYVNKINPCKAKVLWV